jgi:hypothetical protein
MQRSEDFVQRVCGLENLGFSQTQRLSQMLSGKNEYIKLVVVMSAVDSWKSSSSRHLACSFMIRVAWISVRNCGKRERRAWKGQVAPCTCTFDPQLSLAMFTRSAQGFRVTKKSIVHQTNGELEEISIGSSTCFRSNEKFDASRRDQSCQVF